MDVRTVVTDAFLENWTALLSKNYPSGSGLQPSQRILDISGETSEIERVFTLDRVQQYVDRTISTARDPWRLEALHSQRLAELAGQYAQVLFDLVRADLSRVFQVDEEKLYQTALAQLKTKFVNCSAYPCSDSLPKTTQWEGGLTMPGSQYEDRTEGTEMNANG